MTSLNLDTASPPGDGGMSALMKSVLGGAFTVLLLLVTWSYSEARESRVEIRAAIQALQDRSGAQESRTSVNEEAIRNIRESLLRIEAKIDRINLR